MYHHFRSLTNSPILLCVWHVHRAWAKHVGNKVKVKENKVRIFRALGEIMHSCQDDESVRKVVARIFQEFSEEDKFLKYFDTTWLSNDKICKCHITLDHDFFFHNSMFLVNTF